MPDLIGHLIAPLRSGMLLAPEKRSLRRIPPAQLREIRFWRMPSTSRAYPLPLEKKAEAYRKLFK